jgi:cytochrome c553
MRTTKYFMMAALAAGLLGGLGVYQAAEEKAKLDIEQVMEKAHKGKPSLFQKVLKGEASSAEKKELVNLYEELGKNKPPKGSEADWKKRTTALVKAAKGVAEDKEGSTAALKKAANCKACHDQHKSD